MLRNPKEYERWIAAFDTLSEFEREAISAQIESMASRPRISVLLPVYETPERWLRRAIDSVREQLYPDWELCISDDASPSPQIRSILEEYARADPRIRIAYRTENGGIAVNSNSALALVGGEWVALLDADDEIPEEALFLIAQEIIDHPEARLFYSDHDKIDGEGRRYDPNFKPDFSYDLLLSQNCIDHIGVYSTELLRGLGGFRPEAEGSQDYDLALRCAELLRPEQIRHIPRILYHWRAIPGSVATAADAKPYALEGARRARLAHLKRRGLEAELDPVRLEDFFPLRGAPEKASAPTLLPGCWRVRRKLLRRPLATLLIATRDRPELLRRCVESIRERTEYAPYEVVIIDNGSEEEETLAYLEELEASGVARVLRDPGPFHYSALHNRAAAQVEGEVLVLLNNDTEVLSREWLAEMVAHALRPEVGAVGARLLYPDGTVQHAGVVLGLGGIAGPAFYRLPGTAGGYIGQALVVREVSAVTGACLATRTALYRELGGLEERLAIAFSDIDYCLRLRERGYAIVYTPYAELFHAESKSRGYEDTPEKRKRFHREMAWMHRRWGSVLAADPFYNPNLSLDSPGYRLAWPPREGSPWLSRQGTAFDWIRWERQHEELARQHEKLLERQPTLLQREAELAQAKSRPVRFALRLVEQKFRRWRRGEGENPEP